MDKPAAVYDRVAELGDLLSRGGALAWEVLATNL
jgi:hypothetical protein